VANDEYELLPHAEIEHLRREVDRLKKNPLGDTQASISLLGSINALNENIEKLVRIFQSANDDMTRMARDGNVLEQLHRLRDENAKIAHAMVALSEMFDRRQPTTSPQYDEPASPPEPTEHDSVVQEFSDNPFNEPDVPLAQPDAQQDQFTGEPLPPPPRR